MKKVLVILGTICLTSILSGLMGYILWSLMITAIVYLKSEDRLKVYASAFGFGLMQDVVTGFPLGFSSLITLGFALTLFALGVRFRADVKVSLIAMMVFELIYIACFNFISF